MPDNGNATIDEQLLGEWQGELINTARGDTSQLSLILQVQNQGVGGTLSMPTGEAGAIVPISQDRDGRASERGLMLVDGVLSFKTDSVMVCAYVGAPEGDAHLVEVITWEANVTDTLIAGTFKGTPTHFGPPQGPCYEASMRIPPDEGTWQVEKIE